MNVISYQPTTDFLGTCKPCNRPVRWSNPDRPEQHKTGTTRCAQCGATVKGQRIYATQSQRACDLSCQYAKGSKCACTCRGKNHGNQFNPVFAGEQLAANLGLYRERYAKRSEAAKKAAATRAAAKQAALAAAAEAVKAFRSEHRALVVWMATEGTGWLVRQTLRDMDKHLAVPTAERLAELYEAKARDDRHDAEHAQWMADNDAMVAWMGEQTGDFLRSMSEAVQEGHLLTERQEAAVRRIYAEYLATKDVPALEAGRQVVTGTVESIEEEWQGGPYGNGHTVQKMQLRTPQGQLVLVSVTGPVYTALGSNWENLEADLVGKQVAVKATVKASYRKPWCGWGSRPSNFALA